MAPRTRAPAPRRASASTSSSAARRLVGRARRPAAASGQKCSGASQSGPRWVTMIALSILVVLAIALVYQYVVARAPPSGQAERFWAQPGPQQQQQKYTLVFLHMTGCGWCDRFKPDWASFKAQYGGEVGGWGVTLADFERSEAGAAKYSAGVSGYPTLLLFKQAEGTSVKFEGQRTPDALYAFVRDNVKVEGFASEFSVMGQSVAVATADHEKVAKGTREGAQNAGAKL